MGCSAVALLVRQLCTGLLFVSDPMLGIRELWGLTSSALACMTGFQVGLGFSV